MLNFKKVISLSAGILGGRAFGYARELCLIYFYGANAASDTILVVLLMPDLVNNLVSNSAISSVFLAEVNDRFQIEIVGKRVNKYLMEIALFSFIVLGVFSFFYYELKITSYVIIALGSILFNFKFGLEISKSQYFNDFKYTSLANIIYSLGAIAAILFGLINIYLSSVIIVFFSFLRYYLAQKRYKLSSTQLSKVGLEVGVKTLSRKQFIIALTSSSILTLSPMFDKLIAYDMGDGLLSLYNYSEKIYILPLSLVLVPIFSANYPALTRLWNSNNQVEYHKLVFKVLLAAALASGFILVFSHLFGTEFITLLFGMTDIGVVNTRKIISFFNIQILGLIPFVLVIWFINVFLIRKLYNGLFMISIFMVLAKIVYLVGIKSSKHSFEVLMMANIVWLYLAALVLLSYYVAKIRSFRLDRFNKF